MGATKAPGARTYCLRPVTGSSAPIVTSSDLREAVLHQILGLGCVLPAAGEHFLLAAWPRTLPLELKRRDH
jgi:hypothetical protein